MKNALRIALVCLLFLSIPSLTGCGITASAGNPPTVTTFYNSAAVVLNDSSALLVQAQTLFASAHTAGFVDNDQFIAGEKAFISLASNGDTIRASIAQNNSPENITQAITAYIGQVGAVPQQFAIKNPASQAAFTAVMTSVQSVLKASLTLISPPAAVAAH